MYLAVRSDFSFLRSYGTVDQIVSRAVELGHKYVGLADYLSTWGHIPFMKACKKAGIKPILGVVVPVVKDLEKDPRYDLVTIIAKNNKGLSNIYELLGVASGQKYYRHRVTWSQLYALKDVFLIADHVHTGNLFMVRKALMAGMSPKPGSMMAMIKSGEYKNVFSPAPIYPRAQDKEAYDIMMKVSAMAKSQELELGYGPMLSRKDAAAQFEPFDIDPTAAFDLADEIADQCTVELRTAKNVVPKSTMTVEEWARAGAEERGIDLDNEEYRKRFETEMEVLRSKSFEDYFLLVGDVVRYAKDHMLVGPARGSAGGSLICYLMGITELDPIVHGTLFERFIDPTRNDYPDIDIDFPDAKRELVFQYLKDTYGAENVGRIGTISVFKEKSSINDTGRALGIPFDIMRQLSAAIPDGISLADAFKMEEIQSIIKACPNVRKALLIEGHARHHGVHAAGVCVAASPITEVAAMDANGVASLTLNDAEAVGLLKIDVLGLKTLSVIEEACELADLDPSAMYESDWDDTLVWEIFNKDRVAGIFQFEGHAVRQLMKQITVDRFSDLCILASIARPGPLESGGAMDWVNRRNGKDNWEYLHESLEPIVEETQGVMVYQEQAMIVSRDIAGFDVGDVNKLRKAIGKKDPETLHAFHEKFMAGATRIMEKRYAQELWDQIETFGGYAFNKSHATAYGMISYIAAYLKAYYPVEFAVASLRHQGNDDKARTLLRELIEEGYDFVPFDAQVSGKSWSFQNGKIYGGFTSVKGIGEITAEKMLAARAADPDTWLEHLTPVQRKRLLSPNNTPWHDIDRMTRLYEKLYKDPENYKTKNLPFGVSHEILKIANIPEEKTNGLLFIGRLKRKQLRDKNDPNDVNKRDGQKISGPSVFLNLYFEDDTGECGSTISRFKYDDVGAPIWGDENSEGKDYLVKGSIINDGRVWVFIDKMVEISNDERIAKVVDPIPGPDPDQSGGQEEQQGDGGSADASRPETIFEAIDQGLI